MSEQEELIWSTFSPKAAHEQDGTKRNKHVAHGGKNRGRKFDTNVIIYTDCCLQQGNKLNKLQQPESTANNKKKDLSEEDVHLLAKILSVGLVDADPNYLHHLKGYRDLHGA
ncbi:Hypothetical protein SMAX5B_008667 [Scophthalmus maximus]|uniref:Uncharacterized protein n=1 Tax=Scophthalmus maximus TaxID=52904 RepID=A0A2U9CHF7_SCOMX|nr:Hypothetical protein SMAX5B_008667 [Scophthalmus maximus]KAF0027249.1 hypothetical protein F2P81_019990 [Scophthalmus maximus]